jgi:hypothetical protein
MGRHFRKARRTPRGEVGAAEAGAADGEGVQGACASPVPGEGASHGDVPPPLNEAVGMEGSARLQQLSPGNPAVPELCEEFVIVDLAVADAACAAASARTSSVSSVATTAVVSTAAPDGATPAVGASAATSDGTTSAAGLSSGASDVDAASDNDAEGSLPWGSPSAAAEGSAAVTLSAGQVVDAGFSFSQGGPGIEHSWSQGDASAFRVRAGPNYRRTGTKAPSLPALGTVVAMDCLRTPRKVHHLLQYNRIRLPRPTPGWSEAYPEFFVVNQMLPAQLRHMLFTSEGTDGETLNLLAFVRLPPGLGAGWEASAGQPSAGQPLAGQPSAGHSSAGQPAVGGGQLFKRFLLRAGSDAKVGAALKEIGRMTNIDEVRASPLLDFPHALPFPAHYKTSNDCFGDGTRPASTPPHPLRR